MDWKNADVEICKTVGTLLRLLAENTKTYPESLGDHSTWCKMLHLNANRLTRYANSPNKAQRELEEAQSALLFVSMYLRHIWS